MTGEKSMQGQLAVPEDSPKREEVTIKFGKGLVGEPFISMTGKELVEIKIPNRRLTGQRRFLARSTRAGMKAGKVSGEPNPELCPIRS